MTCTGPYDGRMSTGQNDRKPVPESCSVFSHKLYGAVRFKIYFKDLAGPNSMPCDYPWVLRDLAFTGLINCMGDKCDRGNNHKRFKRQSNGTNWLTMDSPMPGP